MRSSRGRIAKSNVWITCWVHSMVLILVVGFCTPSSATLGKVLSAWMLTTIWMTQRVSARKSVLKHRVWHRSLSWHLHLNGFLSVCFDLSFLVEQSPLVNFTLFVFNTRSFHKIETNHVMFVEFFCPSVRNSILDFILNGVSIRLLRKSTH